MLPKTRVVVVTVVRILISPEEMVQSSEEMSGKLDERVRSEVGSNEDGRNEGGREEGGDEDVRIGSDEANSAIVSSPQDPLALPVVHKTPEQGPKGGLICCPQVKASTTSSTTASATTTTSATTTSQPPPPPPQHLTLADRIRNSALTKCYVRARTYTYEVSSKPPTNLALPRLLSNYSLL